jgi:hypothetical protein
MPLGLGDLPDFWNEGRKKSVWGGDERGGQGRGKSWRKRKRI